MQIASIYNILMKSRDHQFKNPYFEKKRKKHDIDTLEFINMLRYGLAGIRRIGYHEPDEDDAILELYEGAPRINLKPEEVDELGRDIDAYENYIGHRLADHKLEKIEFQDLEDPYVSKKDPLESDVKKFITDTVNSIDKSGWEYAFNNDADYETFLNLMIRFSLKKKYQLPKQIKLNNRTKTRFAPVFGIIHKKYSSCTLVKDEKYLVLLKSFSYFKELKDNQILKDITRQGKKIN